MGVKIIFVFSASDAFCIELGFINLNATVKVEFEYFMELKEAAQVKRRKSTSQKRLLRLHLPLARELINFNDTKILSGS